ncbi:MAG: hypothetical protein ACYDHD_06835 [Vulcanimicrobiaceae bacterium]
MDNGTETIAHGNGLTTAVDTIVAPRAAFTTLASVPTWGWAFLIAVVLGAIGSYLGGPANTHVGHIVFTQQAATNPQVAAMSPAQRASAEAISSTIIKFAPLMIPIMLLIMVLIQSVVLLVFNAAGHGKADFKRLWAGLMNISIVSLGLASVLLGSIAAARGADAFSSQRSLLLAVPSLAWIAPHATVKIAAFLSTFNITGIWAAILIYIMLAATAKLSRPVAILGAATILVGSGLLSSVFIH